MCAFFQTQVNYLSNFLFFTFRCLLCRHGDMRVMMAYELFSMWQKLGASDNPIPQHTHTHVTVKHLHLDLYKMNENSVLQSIWISAIQVTTSPTLSQEWWVPSSASPWCLRLRSEILWSQFSTTWWIGSRGKTATSNRSLWYYYVMAIRSCAAAGKNGKLAAT